MRTPNTNCIICNKPLYRRPNELKKVLFVCCKECRSEAYKKYPSKSMLVNLALGREKGTNHLQGIPKSEESKRKRSVTHKIYWEEHPDKLKERGLKTRGENHYQWKGGISSLNQSIRVMVENRKWMDSVKERDKKCTKCNNIEDLESHHLIRIKKIIEKYSIKNRADARNCKELWDINNGITLCSECHCKEHNKIYNKIGVGRKHILKIKKIRNAKGANNPNWKGGLIEKECPACMKIFLVKQCEVNKRKYCSKKCIQYDNRRIAI